MQIPLVESRLALSYSSWFSDSEFAFFVRGFGHALFNLEGKGKLLFIHLIQDIPLSMRKYLVKKRDCPYML